MPAITITPFQQTANDFGEELKDLCKKYNVSNIVALIEFTKQYTAVFQYGDTKQGEVHPTFTSIKMQLQDKLNALLIELQKNN